MALLTTYTSANKVILEAPKTVTASRAFTDWYLQAHIETRTTYTERFKYVGMDYATALSCQAAMITAYTANGICYANVVASPTGGAMWQVEVNYVIDSYTVQDL